MAVWMSLGLGLLLGTYCLATGSQTRPNVLLIVADDLRPSLGCYGEHIMSTPNIDNLATKSVLFERAYAQQGLGDPSRLSLLTSRRPDTTRLHHSIPHHDNHHDTHHFLTLPELFKHNGYFTQSAGKLFPPGQGHKEALRSWSSPVYVPPSLDLPQTELCPGEDGHLHRNLLCAVTVSDLPGAALPDMEVSHFAVEWLSNRTRAPEQPFFLALGFYRPHAPFIVPKEYLDLYPLSDIHLAPNPTHPLGLPDVAWNPWTDLRHYDDVKALDIDFPFGTVPPDFQLKIRQSYMAAVSYLDAQVGKVLTALDTLGLASNTVIAFLSDNGWSLGEHGQWSKDSNYDVVTRVPLLIHVPGLTAPVTSPGGTFPLRDVIASVGSLVSQSLRAHSSYQPSEISSRLLSRLRAKQRSRREQGGPNSDDVVPLVRSYSLSGEPAQTLQDSPGWEHVHNSYGLATALHEEGWRKIFQGNVLPFITRVNHQDRAGEEPGSVASLSYRLSLHVDSHLHGAEAETARRWQYPLTTLALAELVDVFPTLAELAGLPVPRTCPEHAADVQLCTEGSSLLPVLNNVTASYAQRHPRAGLQLPPEGAARADLGLWKTAAFSQCPRPGLDPRDAGVDEARVMGYSQRTADYRYTEWVSSLRPRSDWGDGEVVGRELYLLQHDPGEDFNMAHSPQLSDLVRTLSDVLRRGWRAALPQL